MSGDWQRFGYAGEPGTCLWCGRKLRRKTVIAQEGEPGAFQRGSYSFWEKPASKLGGYQDDHFCGLRCGYQFGDRLAELGRRLESVSSVIARGTRGNQ